MVGSGFARALRVSGGLLLAGAAITLLASLVAMPIGSVGQANRSAWVLVHLALVVASAAILLGLPAIYLRQSGSIGISGLIGVGLLFVGFLGFGFFTSTVQTFLLPWVYDKASCTLGCHLLSTADGPPLFGWFYLVEAVATFVGLILVGWTSARAGSFPAPAGYLLVIAGLLALPTTVINVPALIGLLLLILALVAVGWMGVTLMRTERE